MAEKTKIYRKITFFTALQLYKNRHLVYKDIVVAMNPSNINAESIVPFFLFVPFYDVFAEFGVKTLKILHYRNCNVSSTTSKITFFCIKIPNTKTRYNIMYVGICNICIASMSIIDKRNIIRLQKSIPFLPKFSVLCRNLLHRMQKVAKLMAKISKLFLRVGPKVFLRKRSSSKLTRQVFIAISLSAEIKSTYVCLSVPKCTHHSNQLWPAHFKACISSWAAHHLRKGYSIYHLDYWSRLDKDEISRFLKRQIFRKQRNPHKGSTDANLMSEIDNARKLLVHKTH